jgi:cytidine deaminase
MIETPLLQPAIQAQSHAHAPYSTKFIGSSVLWSDGSITSGCNIENASYGATVCAERVAIWKGISEDNHRRIKEILVVSPSLPPWPPCGMCRQVISEFGDPLTLVHWTDGKTVIKTKTFAEMLPETYDSRFLKNGSSKV